MKLIGEYQNGNVHTKIYDDGTKVRETEDDEFRPAFAENMDIKICDRCSAKCPMCHEGSSPDGALGDILNEKFIDTLHPYTECAIGGGDVFEHPDLILFLQKLKAKRVIPNITVNQIHFMKNKDLIHRLAQEELIYGIGVSLVDPTDVFLRTVAEFPNAVIHTINGILTPEQIDKLIGNDLKVLILGYKTLRRGVFYYAKYEDQIKANQEYLEKNLNRLLHGVKVLSFDNLAIEQLHIKEKLSPEVWEEFYAGDDGTFTYYIDMVNRQFARSSTEPFSNRYPLLDNADEMFRRIQNE